MPSPGFEPRPYGTAVSVTNHYTGWAALQILPLLYATIKCLPIANDYNQHCFCQVVWVQVFLPLAATLSYESTLATPNRRRESRARFEYKSPGFLHTWSTCTPKSTRKNSPLVDPTKIILWNLSSLHAVTYVLKIDKAFLLLLRTRSHCTNESYNPFSFNFVFTYERNSLSSSIRKRVDWHTKLPLVKPLLMNSLKEVITLANDRNKHCFCQVGSLDSHESDHHQTPCRRTDAR
ncbi:hypothetical protein TNCV_3217531 [Trichonephila clavipes]|nr:hypothetical protein TNCV_3217531 [Trichonephila clavipes]